MTRYLIRQLSAAMLLLAATTSVACGAVLTSAPFSLGYGFSRDSGSIWNTDETAGVNTATTIGAFTLSPAPSGPRWSGNGATFVNRILGNGGDGAVSAYIDDAAFQLPVTGSYNGAAPADVSATPNYKLRLDISSVSIYAGAHPSSSLASVAWDETTPGHTATSPSTPLTPSTNYDQTTAYGHLVWDPAYFDVPLGSLNDSYTRTFDILGGNGLRFGDGIEVQGTVNLVYDAVVVPEPTSLGLISLAVVLGICRRVRKMSII